MGPSFISRPPTTLEVLQLMSDSDRRQRGLELRKRLFGPNDAPTLGDAFTDITVDHLFGEIWTRPGLALRDRSLITCAVLTALGKEPQLKVHLRGLLNQGLSPQGIEEMMIHLAHYSGWPTAVNGLRVAREVFAEAKT